MSANRSGEEKELFLQPSCILNSFSLKGQHIPRSNKHSLYDVLKCSLEKVSSPSCSVYDEDPQMNDQVGCFPRCSDLLPSKGATDGRTEKRDAAKRQFCRCLWFCTGSGRHMKPPEKQFTFLFRASLVLDIHPMQ